MSQRHEQLNFVNSNKKLHFSDNFNFNTSVWIQHQGEIEQRTKFVKFDKTNFYQNPIVLCESYFIIKCQTK